MYFQTVFDVVGAGYRNWSIAAFGLIFVAISGLFLCFPGLADVPRRFHNRNVHGDRYRVRSARNSLLTGQFEVVEGTAEDHVAAGLAAEDEPGVLKGGADFNA